MNRPMILCTNDDGIASPGLAAAAEALLPLGRLVVAAPLRQQTSMGRAHTGDPDARFEPYPLRIDGHDIEAYSLDASPAAVVRHFFLAMPDRKPDLVVAGVNYGENIGVSVTSSGTVGAALEAAMRGSPALALSLETEVDSQREYSDQDWSGSIHFTRYFAAMLLRRGMPPGVDLFKVEIPAGAGAETPWHMTRLSPFMYYHSEIAAPCLESRRCDVLFRKQKRDNEPRDTDAYAVRTARCVAVTPLSLDLTARTPLESVLSWVKD
ncbi:5'-nucleotidase SurE [uncultured delta proteobacterium]|uniref:5'-nucleotidase n=1 Tax=uncultured delta proteobacterium TaxID=34034 RepID=A0A212J221_9DELT|nr:5'-nucleotidase SurE [uncultured delta proteobacterium]